MIICIGDSITVGQHLEPPDVAWPFLLQNERVLVMAVPGETTRMALERWPRDVQAHEPEIVVIQYGHNDANRWETDRGLPRVSPAAYAANLAEMIARCRAFGGVPYLCTLTPSTRSEQHARDVQEYDVILREVARQERAAIIDTRMAFAGPDVFLNSGAVAPRDGLLLDGLHLSADGHRLFALTVGMVLA